jgi:hypothetical protein
MWYSNIEQHFKAQLFISILLISSKENSRTQSSRIDKHNMMSKQLEMLLDIQQNLQTATMPRVEEKIQKLQKQLSDLKLSNKNMKTQLTRINVLKVSKENKTSKNSLTLWSIPILVTCL